MFENHEGCDYLEKKSDKSKGALASDGPVDSV